MASSVTDKANNSHDLHDDSKKQNDQTQSPPTRKMIIQSTSQHKPLIQLLNLKIITLLQVKTTQRLLLKLNKVQQLMLNKLKILPSMIAL